MGLITETNAQYYSGQQVFPAIVNQTNPKFTCTFNTAVVSAYDSSGNQIGSNSNYTIYFDGVAQAEASSYISDNINNVITLIGGPFTVTEVYVQLKTTAVESNYGSYENISVTDIVNNFIVAYVGMDKLIPRVKRSDVIFHAKRGLQEFSYDTLKSVKSQELTIPHSLNIVLPQDYVNYVSVCYIDQLGVKRHIYPANNLTTSPYQNLVQDATGIPIQDNFGSNVEGNSITEERWKKANDVIINQGIFDNLDDYAYWANYYGFDNTIAYGQLYGLEPQYAQVNGWFNPNYREGKMSFSSDLVNKLIVLEYISDGLAYDLDSKVPKLAEDAIYAYILHAIISTRANQQEYLVQRLKKDKSAKLRNAKIRLSNIKLDEIVQVMRGKSKWIKH